MPGVQRSLLVFVSWGAQGRLEWRTERFRRTRPLGVWLAPCGNHRILDLSFAQPQTGRVGEGAGVGLAQQDPLLLAGAREGGPLGCTCSVVGWGCLPSWLMLGGLRSGHCPLLAPPP